MTTRSLAVSSNNVLLVNLNLPKTPRTHAVASAVELYRLVESLGGLHVVEMFSRRGSVHPATFIGSGRLESVSRLVLQCGADYVIINSILKPRQLFRIWRHLAKIRLNIIVWDRIDLILTIFARHAHTSASQLEIRLAALRHMGPRIYGMGLELSKQSGGIGVRGIGETNTELMKRHWRQELGLVTKKLEKLALLTEETIRKRRRRHLFQVALVGYTNAGKTSLFNLLTRKQKFVRDYLFATLDTTVGRVYLPEVGREVIISDTVGFIADLPPELIRAFQSTLAEVLHANLIIHVVDASDPDFAAKAGTVAQVLGTLGISRKPQLLVLTKTDLSTPRNFRRVSRFFSEQAPVAVSAASGFGKNRLILRISLFLQNQRS
jgi:GTP-binding protein HflX